MTPRTVLSMEQALSLPYATLRFAQLGWRVIRIEATGGGGGLPGDPNRYIGSRMGGGDDRRSYFIAPNVGKQAIALNLKDPRGQHVLQRLIEALEVDVFCCNTVPSRYQPLGIDYATLRAAKPDLIWAGISAQGPQVPDAPGYDPVIQAMAGYMEVTGDPNGPPMLTGIPVKKDIAMTGEVTLRGNALAIGGLKEKLLAALRGGIKTVFIPEENAKDLIEIPDNVKTGLEIVPVSHVREVLARALVRQPEAIVWDEAAEELAAKAAAEKSGGTGATAH